MDKRKLVNIIVKDLEELKILSEEVAESEDNSSLIIDLAVNKARLLIQEIELLRELAGNSVSMQNVTEEEEHLAFGNEEEEEEEVSDISFSDPELEILNFEEREFPETEELPEEEELEDDEEELDEEDLDEEEIDEEDAELDEEEDLKEEEEEIAEDEVEPELENTEEDLEEENLTETDGEDKEEEDTDEEEEEVAELEDEDKEEPLQKTNVQVTELSNSPQPGIREIHIDDDDDDIEPMHFEPLKSTSAKPLMHEIPKPDNTAVGQNFQKERSLNDSMGETKMESKLSNSPITSLRAAIGLNDRFLFIREIFNNNSEKYNAVIEHLDKMEQIQEAVEYLKANLSMEKNETTMKFVDLLKRRFTKP